MAKTLEELAKREPTAWEMAEEIVNFGCYCGVREAHELVAQLSLKELKEMYEVGKIVEKYPQGWDEDRD